jgi:glycosyltransferase involved in cell wall biosynthesis
MLRTIFLTASKGDEGKNFEHIMRIIFLSKYSDLTMLVTSKADFDRYLNLGTKTVRSPFSGKFGLIIFSSYWLFKNRKNLNNVILFTEPSVIGIAGFIGKLFSNIKWIVDVWDIPIRHQKYLSNGSKLTELRIKLTRYLMRVTYIKADLFIVGIRPDFQFRYYHIPDSKILAWQTTIWLPQKTENSLIHEDEGHFNILCMKSVHTPSCGLDILMQAFLRVKSTLIDVRLWIIGRVREDVEATIKNFRNIDGVEFLGFLEHNRVMKFIRRSHICVIPWQNDVDLAQAYPTKVMEYMSNGKALIAPKIAAISDMIKDGEDGLLFQPGDPHDLADKILHLYNDRKLRQLLAKNAQRYHPKFDTIRKHEMIFKVLEMINKDKLPADVHTIDSKWLY